MVMVMVNHLLNRRQYYVNAHFGLKHEADYWFCSVFTSKVIVNILKIYTNRTIRCGFQSTITEYVLCIVYNTYAFVSVY